MNHIAHEALKLNAGGAGRKITAGDSDYAARRSRRGTPT